jgi:hypothetical protein
VNSWHSYPSSFALGHRAIADLLLDPVVVEEKVDGSQFSFGVFSTSDGARELRCRSKGAQLNIVAPEKMFAPAVAVVQELERQGKLTLDWTYRAEYLKTPKHNVLAYDRIPASHIIIFDINPSQESYLAPEGKRIEAASMGLETVPCLFEGKIESYDHFRELLERTSVLGGQKIEGVVVKNYHRFGQDKKALIGKFVSEAFKEVHAAEWKTANPGAGDVIELLGETLRTPARWAKAVQHLREAGRLEDSPRDIGFLMKEVQQDVLKECEAEIAQRLLDYALPKIRRKIVAGLPEWYKDELLKRQFNAPIALNGDMVDDGIKAAA